MSRVAAPDPMARSVMEPVSVVLDHLKTRASQREDFLVRSVADLAIHWKDEGPKAGKPHYVASVDGKELPLAGSAEKTACRLIKTTPKYFRQFADKSAFPQSLRNVLDNPAKPSGGVLVRHDGMEIKAILPADYQIRDAYTMLDEIIPTLERQVGKIQGIQKIESGWGDRLSYRMVMNRNIMPSIGDRGQYLMLALGMSEHGLADTRLNAGLFRTLCVNSAVRTQGATWDHKASLSTFLNRTSDLIDYTGEYQGQFTQVFEALLKTYLEFEPANILKVMKDERLISRDHFTQARQFAEMNTEDGRACETQYDLFNALTRAAQDMPTMQAREQAETATMEAFTHPGGLFERIRQAAQSAGWKRRVASVSLN